MASSDDTLRYVKFDYDSHLDAIIQRVRARYPAIWNDFQTGNFGRVFLDIVAWSTASTAFTLNRAAAENYISTMTLRESAIRVGSLVSYKLRGPAPATVACDTSLFSAAAADVLISKGTPVRTADNLLSFEVSKDYIISVGQVTPIRVVVQFNPNQTGTSILQTLVQVYAGKPYADLLDTTINANDYAEVGQLFRQTNPTSSTEYQISDFTSGPNATAKNRILFSSPWSGADSVITAEIVDRSITLVQGQTITEQFVTSSATIRNYTVKLGRSPVIDNSVTVTVNGDEWVQVDSLYTGQATDQIFEVTTLPSGSTIVEFGDGVFGQTVPTDATLVVTYRVGGGVAGNIASGAINTTLVGLIPSLSNPINVNVSNSRPGFGGLDAETLEEARANIPAYTRAGDRGVTTDDYEALASGFSDPKFGQIRYARAFTRAENDFLERNIVVVSAWTSGVNGSLAPVRGSLKAALLDYLQRKAVGTDYVVLTDGSTRPLPVSVRFKVLPGVDVNDATDSLLAQMQSIVAQLRPGNGLIFSDFVRSLDEVPGIDSLNIATPIADLYPSTQDELFTAPDPEFVYSLALQSSNTTDNAYTATFPVSPLTPWAFQLFLGGAKLEVLPDAIPGYALISGANLSKTIPSKVNLLAGSGTFAVDGVPGTLTMKLNPAIGYARERTISVYIGYRADGDSQLKRREIRAALRAWISGFPPGASVFASPQTNVAASSSNVTGVVLAVNGVVEVTRVSFETASNPSPRIDLDQFELPRFDNIYLNNISD
jgi:hypothetical protein